MSRVDRLVLAGVLTAGAIGGFGGAKLFESHPANADVPAATGSTSAPTPRASESLPPTPTPVVTNAPARALEACPIPNGVAPETPRLGDQITDPIPFPSNMSQVHAFQLNESTPQGQWLHIIYDPTKANAENDWIGIGPWAPNFYKNIDPDAVTLAPEKLGTFLIRQNKGGRFVVGFDQLMKHQNETNWSSESGTPVQNNDWKNQYTFKGVINGTEIRVFDPDSGRQMLWPDRSPIIWGPNNINGDFSFRLPKACGDVRVAFMITMPAPQPGMQKLEIKVQRGADNHPELKGENDVPNGAVKTPVPGQ